MRIYVTIRLDEAEIAAVYKAFEWSHLVADQLRDEPRQMLFGSKEGICHPGAPFIPFSMIEGDGYPKPFKVNPAECKLTQDVVRRERDKYRNHFDDFGGGVYPVGVLHMTHLFLRLVWSHLETLRSEDPDRVYQPWYKDPLKEIDLQKISTIDILNLEKATKILETASNTVSIFRSINDG